MNTNNREILQIALPSIVSNITVPLLGLIDVTIVGHLGAASYIGAIAVGGMLFNIIYWIFGFLRMGTGGMTSQAYGRKDSPEMMRLLTRSTGVGLLIALALLVLQYPIERIAFIFIGFILMIGGGSDNPDVFNDAIFSFRRITLAPILVLIGFGIEIYAIMKKPKDE